MQNKVVYIHSDELERLGNTGTHPAGRSNRVHSLINSLDLLDISGQESEHGSTLQTGLQRVQVVAPRAATEADLLRYHSKGFVDFLLDSERTVKSRMVTDSEGSGYDTESGGSDASTSQSCDSRPSKKRRIQQTPAERFGLMDDCPPFPELSDYTKLIAGSTLTAAETLLQEAFEAVINWEGGRHHALRDRCSGFCYVQDVVLGIDHLRRHGKKKDASNETGSTSSSNRKPRVMYLDLDVHFGDAPAAAFKHPYRYSSPLTSAQKRQSKPQVMTVSVHHHSPGFFPSTTEAGLTSPTSLTPCTISIPLRRAASAPTYARIWQTCIEPLRTAFEPDYVVLLLGMDALAGDKLVDGAANWSTKGEGGVAWCMERVMEWGCKLLVLGGGGYHRANTAKGWAVVTSTLLSRDIPEDVPPHDYWAEYSPSFQMHVESSTYLVFRAIRYHYEAQFYKHCEHAAGAKDENTDTSLDAVEQAIHVLASRITEIMAT